MIRSRGCPRSSTQPRPPAQPDHSRSPRAATPGCCAPARASPTAAARRPPGGRTTRKTATARAAAGCPARSGAGARRRTRPRSPRRPAAPPRRRPRRAAGCAQAPRPPRRAARTPRGRRRGGSGRRRAPDHSKQRAGGLARPCERAVTQLDAVARKRARVTRQVQIASGGQEAGASPARSRHRHRVLRSGAGNCPARLPSTRDEDPEEGSDTCAAHHTGSRPGDPPAVHLGHRPAVGPRVRRRLPPAPTRPASPDLPALLDRADLVVVRVLGGRRSGRRASTPSSPPAGRSSCSAASRRRTPS